MVVPRRGSRGEPPLLLLPGSLLHTHTEGGGGVRRQMLNDSLKATAPTLISSPVCAGCHRNWPEHFKGWITLQYTGLQASRRIYWTQILIKSWCNVELMQVKVTVFAEDCCVFSPSIKWYNQILCNNSFLGLFTVLLMLLIS